MNASIVQKILPIATWLPAYKRSWLRADVLAGITVWALVIPQAIAYAQIAGLPPQAGVFAAFAAPLGYAIFGTSRQLVTSPTSSTAAISAALVVPLAAGTSGAGYAELSAALAILCGIAFFVLGRLRMGFLSQFIAPAVQAGFLVGLGLTIIAGQTWKLLGIAGIDGPFYKQAWQLMTSLNEVSGWTLAIGATSLGALVALRIWAPALPAALLVVVMSTIAVALFDLEDRGVSVVGEVDRAVPLPALPTIPLEDWLALVPGALAIVVIGYSESMSITRRFADEHRYRVRPNQELVALGAASAFGGVFQGFITSGGASQSAANDSAGAKTQVSSLVLAAMAFLSAIALLPLFRDLPQAVLAAIVITAVSGFVDIPAIREIRLLRRDSFAMAGMALVGVLVLGILSGLLITVAISLLYLLGRLSRPHMSVTQGDGEASDEGERSESMSAGQQAPGIVTIRPDVPLMFINSGWIRDEIADWLASTEPVPDVIELDLGASWELDVSGVEVLQAISKDVCEVGAVLRLTNVRPAAWNVLARGPAADLVRSPDPLREDRFGTL